MSSRINVNEMTQMRMQSSKIQQFYKDKVILLTGGTGFLGKILIEKLLRSCPGVKHIYLLVREKNGVNVEDRLIKLLDCVMFSRMKKENPRFMESLTVIHGDLHRHRLGLDKNHESLLIQNVNIILHSAATIRFDERLSIAISTNVAATKQLCLLAQEMVNLKAFVYVSTAYSNCESPIIQEKICPPPICPDKLINLAELLEDSILNEFTSTLIGNKPNTYIFTKCAAEEIINRFKSTLPVAIFRPSIVLGTMSEPMPGWIDNVQGPTGVAVGMSAGLLRTVMCAHNATANLVPVDLTANAIITLAYSVATQNWQCSQDREGLPIVNFVSTATNSMTWEEFRNLLRKHVRQNPSQNLLWYPFITTPQHHWSAAIHNALLHYLPAKVIDFLSARCGRPTRLIKLYYRLDKYSKAVNYFSTRHFNFEEHNVKMLWENLEPQDRELFPFNMADVHWESYFSNYIRGCRQYLLKEDPATIEPSRQRVKVLYLIHMTVKSIFYLLAMKGFWFIFKLLGGKLLIQGVNFGNLLKF